MRRVGKILVCTGASLAAAVTTWYALWLSLFVWAATGATLFTEADVPRIAAMFAEATTLPDNDQQVLLGLNRHTRLVVVPLDITPREADGIAAVRHTRWIWDELAWHGSVDQATRQLQQELPVDVAVVLVDRDKGSPEYRSTNGSSHNVGRAGCGIHLLLSDDRTRILKAEIQVVAGTLPPFWRTVLEPCIARGLFASVGLVGDSCIVRPSVLCGRDSLGRGTTIDYVLLRVLKDVRQNQEATPEAVESAILQVLDHQSNTGGFNNFRRARLSKERALLNHRIKSWFYTFDERGDLALSGRETWWERWLWL